MAVDIVQFAWCPDNSRYETKVGDYFVYFDSRSGWSCGCKGFKYRKTCKHIVQADEERCHWGEGAISGSPESSDNDKCPDCGQKLIAVMVGV